MERYQEIERELIKIHRKNIWSKFVKAICDYDMIKDGDKIAVGLSGGKDSVTLLHILKNYQMFSPEKFDLIFLDPPYADNLAEATIKAIDEAKILEDGGIIIAETDEGQPVPDRVGELELYDKRKYGRININFYKKI